MQKVMNNKHRIYAALIFRFKLRGGGSRRALTAHAPDLWAAPAAPKQEELARAAREN